MSIISAVSSAVKSQAIAAGNKLLGGLPGAGALNGIFASAFGQLINGIASSINAIPILAEVSAFVNSIGDSVFSALDGLGAAFGAELGEIVDVDGALLGTDSLQSSLSDIAGFVTEGSPTFNLNLGNAAIAALKGGNIRAALDGALNANLVPVVNGIVGDFAGSVGNGVLGQITDTLGDLPISIPDVLPGGLLPAGAEVVIDAAAGKVLQKVIRGGVPSLEALGNTAANAVLNRVSGAAVTQVKNAAGEVVNQILPSGGDLLRNFPSFENSSIIVDEDGVEIPSAGAGFIDLAIEEAKKLQALDPTTPVVLGEGTKISAGGIDFPIPEIKVPSVLASAGSALLDGGGIKDIATKVGTDLLQKAAFSIFPALPIPQGGIKTESRKPFQFQDNSLLAQAFSNIGDLQNNLQNETDRLLQIAAAEAGRDVREALGLPVIRTRNPFVQLTPIAGTTTVAAGLVDIAKQGIEIIEDEFFGIEETSIQTLEA